MKAFSSPVCGVIGCIVVSPALNEIEEPSSAMPDGGASSNGGERVAQESLSWTPGVTVPRLDITVDFFAVPT